MSAHEKGLMLVLRHHRFGRLWAAKAISHAGDGAALVALILYAEQTGRGGVAVSAVLLALTLPHLLGPLAGAIADRGDQRIILLLTAIGQGVIYGTIAIVLPPFPAVIALVGVAAALATLASTTGSAIVPTLVPPEDLVRANSWMGSALALQGTLGSAVGGVLVAVFSTRAALGANAATFAIAAAFLIGLPSMRSRPAAEGRPALLQDTWEGLRYALSHGVARAVVVGLGFGVLFASLDDVALVFLAKDDLHAGAAGFGILSAAYGLGFLASTVWLARSSTEKAAAVFMTGLVLTAVGGLLTALAPVLALAVIAQSIGGSGNGLGVVATHTLIQHHVPASHRGRVFGVVGSATLLGSAVARGVGGFVVDATSATATFVIAGTGVAAVAAVTAFLLRAVKHRSPGREED